MACADDVCVHMKTLVKRGLATEMTNRENGEGEDLWERIGECEDLGNMTLNRELGRESTVEGDDLAERTLRERTEESDNWKINWVRLGGRGPRERTNRVRTGISGRNGEESGLGVELGGE